MPARPYVLSIAGFDPSAGAGILADIKTFESNGVYGLGVCSANTFQNDVEFKQVYWIDPDTMIRQIELLQKRFQFDVVKIGLIQNLQVLGSLVHFLTGRTAGIKIIWDPVLKASAGFEFHPQIDAAELLAICKIICLISPNLPEAEKICSEVKLRTIQELSACCPVYLKGGHSEGLLVSDTLFMTNGIVHHFDSERILNGEKHGSGCVLSSAIAANLAKGHDLPSSCAKAKAYIETFIKSTQTRLGYHEPLMKEATEQVI